MECRVSLPLLTWAQIKNVFVEKYAPHSYYGQKKDIFLMLDQGNISVASNKAKFLSYLIMHFS